jgi:hypothetical protein
MSGYMLPLPLMPSWCGAYARPRNNLALETANEKYGEC